MDLTDEQWEILEPLIPDPPRREDGRGRPWRDPRDVLNGILWILRTGAPWKDLPERYPPYQTCHRRFQKWTEEGILSDVLEALAEDLEKRGKIDLSECYIDGTFVVAKKATVVVVKLLEARTEGRDSYVAVETNRPLSQGLRFLSTAPTMASSFLIQAVSATFFGLPAATNRP